MQKVFGKIAAITLLSFVALGLNACETTRNERVLYSTVLGAGIGAGISAAGGGDVVASVAVGSACGAVVGFLSEDWF